MRKAYSYLRFSTPEQAKGDSHRRQSELARDYAARHGLDLDESSYKDLGVSSFRGTNARTGALGQFLAAVDNGFIPVGSMLLVENLDRVSRQDPWDALPVFQQIINAGVTIVTLQDGKAWSRETMREQPMRLFESLFTMVRAHEESETKSRRLKASWSAKRANAPTKVISARGPAWLRLGDDRKWQVLEERANVVRRIFTLAASGAGENGIASTLNRDGIATWGDNGRAPAVQWHKSYVTKVLNSSAVIGTLTPSTMVHDAGRKTRRAEQPVAGYYPAIVSAALWSSVRALKATPSPSRGRHAAAAVQNVLGGLARCAVCGKAMTRVYKGSAAKAGPPKLVCTGAKTGAGCEYLPMPLDAVEEALGFGFERIAYSGPNERAGTAMKEGIDLQYQRIDEIDSIIAGLTKDGTLVRHSGAMQILNDLLKEKEDLKWSMNKVRDTWEWMSSDAISARLMSLKTALAGEDVDRQAANIALRQLFSQAEIDVRLSTIRLDWKTGGSVTLPVAFPTTAERMSANAKRQMRTSTGRYLRAG